MTTGHDRFQRTEVDGVLVLHTDGDDGRLQGGLVFRVGMCDEELPAHGITHLIEHLALFPHRNVPFSMNGMTGMTTTSFVADGSPQEVGAHLSNVAATLAQLPYERLEIESRVLRAEAARRSASAQTAALAIRYGATSFGLPNREELGLHHPSAQHLEAWRQYFMTRGNAFVWLSGPPPPELDLSALPSGDRRPVPMALPLPLQTPARARLGSEGVSVSMTSARTTAHTAAMVVLSRVLHERLRNDLGLSYHVGLGRELLSSELAHWTIGADCRPDDTAVVIGHIQAEFARLRVEGIPSAELARYASQWQRAELEEHAPLSEAVAWGHDWLLGIEPPTFSALGERVAGLTPQAVSTALVSTLTTALWLVPRGVEFKDKRIVDVASWSATRLHGTVYKLREEFDGGPTKERFIVGAEGLSWEWEEGEHSGAVTVMWAAAVAAIQHPDGWTIIGRDGFQVHIVERMWIGGDQVTASIAAHVPPERVVRSGDRLAANPA